MFSVILTLTVISGIALTNLLLGFASALLIGRGPKRWSDLDEAVTVRYFSPSLMFARAQHVAHPDMLDLPSPPAPAAPAPEPPDPAAAQSDLSEEVEHEAVRQLPPAPPPPPAHPAAWDPATQKLVLTPLDPPAPAEEEPPETVFSQQLEMWRGSSDREEEIVCLSGFMVTIRDPDAHQHMRESLLKAVQARISGQLRKDRRVLRIADHQLVWFSGDVSPDEGIMPVERIRQLLGKTRFLHEGHAVAIGVQAAVVAVSVADRPAELIRRMQATWQYALEKADEATCVDVGRGPEFVQPAPLDLDEIDCAID